MDDLYEKLQNEVQTVAWDALAPHAARGAVLLVAPDLELAAVGVGIARDDTAAVTGWVQGGKLAKPSLEMIRQWESEEGGETFAFVIVQPYVLVQRPKH